jgi:hypothetical protein
MENDDSEVLDDEELDDEENDEAHLSDVLVFLRRNDPSETNAELELRFFPDADALALAFESNDHVNEISLYLAFLANNNSNWDSLLCVLATREKLRTVYLSDEYAVAQRNTPDGITRFLIALQQYPEYTLWV